MISVLSIFILIILSKYIIISIIIFYSPDRSAWCEPRDDILIIVFFIIILSSTCLAHHVVVVDVRQDVILNAGKMSLNINIRKNSSSAVNKHPSILRIVSSFTIIFIILYNYFF